MSERYIEVCRWEEFQHYKDRQPPWIKNYTRLLDDENYLGLTDSQRAVLHGLWLAYAKTSRKVPENTAWLSRYLSIRVTKRTLSALSEAGFIRFVASSTLAKRYQDASPEKEEEKEIDPSFHRELQDVGNGRTEGISELPYAEVLKDF